MGVRWLDGPCTLDGHVVFRDPRSGIEVDDGIDAYRVREIDVAMLQLIGGSGEVGRAVNDADPAKDGRLGNGAADAEIHAASQLRIGVLEVELRRRGDVNIQPHVVGRRIWIRRRRSAGAHRQTARNRDWAR